MKRAEKAAVLGLMAATFLTLASLYTAGPAGCGGGSGEDRNFACSFEKRVTDGCDGFGFGEWEADCFYFNEDDYTITAEEVCANFTEGGVTCASDCCIDTEFQNVELNEGFCS